MITTLLIIVFVMGYLAIAFEHTLKINKAAQTHLIFSFKFFLLVLRFKLEP